MKSLLAAFAATLCAISFFACDDDDDDNSTEDGGQTLDGSSLDSGTTDAAAVDGGASDGGESDGSGTDGGSADGGEGDSGENDSGEQDGGGSDAGETDGSLTDGGSGDGGEIDGSLSDGGETDGGNLNEAFAALVQSGQVTDAEIEQYCGNYIQSEGESEREICIDDLRPGKALNCLTEFTAYYNARIDEQLDEISCWEQYMLCLNTNVGAYAEAIHQTEIYHAFSTERARADGCAEDWAFKSSEHMDKNFELTVLWDALSDRAEQATSYYNCVGKLACNQTEYVWGYRSGEAAEALCWNSDAPIYVGGNYEDVMDCQEALTPMCQDEWVAMEGIEVEEDYKTGHH